MQNKLLNRYLLPHYIFVSSIFLVTLASFETLKDDSKIAQVIFKEKPSYKKTPAAKYILISAFILVLAAMAVPYITYTKKSAQKHINEITKQYIAKIQKDYPELQQYADILQNQQSLQYIAAIACNGLTKKEIKDILYAANDIINNSEKSDEQQEQDVSLAYANILNIVKKHADENPQYAQDIIQAIENAHKTYTLVPQKDKTR